MTEYGIVDRIAKERREERDLAPWAQRSATSAGRRHPEPPDPLRTAWERDRDRVVHTTAFRRLMYKTQVFINRRGDHQRTRLSHTLEVHQVARSIASGLGLNEPLTEVLALCHDIGHPPFGHRGEEALDERMREHGGFRHNAQVLRVVDRLERRSPEYPGLNLTREVRESLLKHENDRDWPADLLPRPRQPWLEAQVVDLADSTAYHVHDVEDGLTAGMFEEPVLEAEVALWRRARAEVERLHPGFLSASVDRRLVTKRLTNQLLKICLNDLIQSSARRLAGAGLRRPEDARRQERLLIGHGDELRHEVRELRLFLYRRFYRHPELVEFSAYARRVIDALFQAYRERPAELPSAYRGSAEREGLERAVCDYIAGMTDRFAEREYERLTGKRLDWTPSSARA